MVTFIPFSISIEMDLRSFALNFRLVSIRVPSKSKITNSIEERTESSTGLPLSIFYSFNAPPARPMIKYFWNIEKSIRTGSIAIKEAVASRLQSTSPYSPINL